MSDRKGNGGVVDENAPETPAAETPAAPRTEEATGLTPVEEPVTREALVALERERNDLREQLLRRRADFENLRKRVERDRQQARLDATVDIFQDLLPVLDNFDRALEAAGPEASLRDGVEMIRRQIAAILETSGVQAQDPLGQPFDPQCHQALSHEAVPGEKDGTVVEVFRKAYYLGGRLLRPALVKVAKGEAPEESTEDEAVH